MASGEPQPATQALIDGLFPPEFFRVDLRQLNEDLRRNKRSDRKSVGRPRAGQKALLSGKDFVLPELVGHAENGDLSISIGASSDGVQQEQVFRLAECGEVALPTFANTSYAEQQLEKRRYSDFLKRVPRQEVEQIARKAELETWQRGGPEADGNFHCWWERRQRRRQAAFRRKANRLANCGFSGRRMDCRDHPEEHQFFGAFKCECRYCRRCGADIFAGLADLEIAFHTVRRVHTMGLFYHADLCCPSQCSHCEARCELVNGHEGEHQCRYHGHENCCPLCNGHLMFPRESGYAPISELKKEGRRELGELRRQLARDRVFQGPRGPDEQSQLSWIGRRGSNWRVQ